jgi:hypothetical protein
MVIPASIGPLPFEDATSVAGPMFLPARVIGGERRAGLSRSARLAERGCGAAPAFGLAALPVHFEQAIRDGCFFLAALPLSIEVNFRQPPPAGNAFGAHCLDSRCSHHICASHSPFERCCHRKRIAVNSSSLNGPIPAYFAF